MNRIIEVTWHAVEQFKERFPDESGASSYVRLLIAKEIEEALDHHRVATKQPRWSRMHGKQVRGYRNGKEYDRTLRYVWTENMNRLYLVDKHGGAFRVVTSISPDGDSRAK